MAKSRALRIPNVKAMPKNKLFRELRQELECVLSCTHLSAPPSDPRTTLLNKVGMVARDMLQSSTDSPHTMGSNLEKCAQDAVKAWRAQRARERQEEAGGAAAEAGGQ